jgi:hypothetical protein
METKQIMSAINKPRKQSYQFLFSLCGIITPSGSRVLQKPVSHLFPFCLYSTHKILCIKYTAMTNLIRSGILIYLCWAYPMHPAFHSYSMMLSCCLLVVMGLIWMISMLNNWCVNWRAQIRRQSLLVKYARIYNARYYSPTSGSRSVGIVRSRTQTMQFSLGV